MLICSGMRGSYCERYCFDGGALSRGGARVDGGRDRLPAIQRPSNGSHRTKNPVSIFDHRRTTFQNLTSSAP